MGFSNKRYAYRTQKRNTAHRRRHHRQNLTGDAFGRFRQQCRLKETIAVDFGGVKRADSACVSLLLEVLRGCKGSVRLTGIPESVRALSELYEIKDWLKS